VRCSTKPKKTKGHQMADLFEFVFEFLTIGSPNGKARWYWGIFWLVLFGGVIAYAYFR
jgi:hypothetical protein